MKYKTLKRNFMMLIKEKKFMMNFYKYLTKYVKFRK